MRRMMQQGLRDRNGDELMGMREMLERLRERRREMLERYDLGGVYEDIAERLREIVDQEREGIERRVDDAMRGGDQRQQEIVEQSADQHREQLDQLPPDLAGRVQELQQYEWMDDARAPAVRGAHGGAQGAADAELLQPDVRGHAEPHARAHAAHEGHDRPS